MIKVFVHFYSAHQTDPSVFRSEEPHYIPTIAIMNIDLCSKFKGKILSEEEMTALERAIQVAKKTNEEVKVHDVSRMIDKIKAIKAGIWKTPAIIINGKKHVGLSEILELASDENTS